MSDILRTIQDNVSKVVVGREETVKLLLSSLAAGGHVLIEDVPGTGKTVMARALASSCGLSFGRIQFTPDLLPGDVTGINYFDQKAQAFVFRQGPVFSQILLADEINRAMPRTQSALLECMAEGQVTVDGETSRLREPFFVMATQNPIEQAGTFPLPEAQLDRFMMKIRMGAMSEAEELKMIDRFIDSEPLQEISAVAGEEEIAAVRRACRGIFVHDDLKTYIVRLVQNTRARSTDEMPCIEEGVSPRGTLALLRASQGYAMVSGRDYVTPEDIRAVVYPVLVHRMMLTGSEDEKRARIKAAVSQTEVPTEDWHR